MKRLLLTGASGFLGWNFCRFARSEWDITGCVLAHPFGLQGVRVVRADVTDRRAMKTIFRDLRPDAVLHLAALSDPNYCQRNGAESYRVNVASAMDIAGLCADHSIPFVFTSSDLVFDGCNPPYREEDGVCPVNLYGEHKVLAERGVLERHEMTAVCRMPLMFGEPGVGGVSFIQPMIAGMRAGKNLRLFTDEVRSPISARNAVQGLLIALSGVRGILHLGGAESVSRHAFGRLLADVFGFPETLVTPCLQKDASMAAPRSKDVTLASEKAFRLGFRPAPLREELTALRDAPGQDRPPRSKGPHTTVGQREHTVP